MKNIKNKEQKCKECDNKNVIGYWMNEWYCKEHAPTGMKEYMKRHNIKTLM